MSASPPRLYPDIEEALREALRGLEYIAPAIPTLRTMFMTADLKLGAQKAEEMDASNKEATASLKAVLIAIQSRDHAQGSPDHIEINRLSGLLADAQRIVAEYQASTIAGARTDVAAHGLPGARGQAATKYCDFPVCNCASDIISAHTCPAGLPDEPPVGPSALRQRDMTIVGGLFALRFLSDGQMAELYIEDDEFYHLKASFNRSWLNDLQIVAEAGDDCKDGPSVPSTKSGGAAPSQPFSQCEQCWQPATCKKYGCSASAHTSTPRNTAAD